MRYTAGVRLLDRIRSRDARVGVIGLGYVGFPLAIEFAKAGFVTVAIDVDARKVARIERGDSYSATVSDDDLATVTNSGRLQPTTDFTALAGVDSVHICVPTPLRDNTRIPDLSFVVSAVDEVVKRLRPGQLVVLESTTYPGTVQEVVRPKLEAGGLRAGTDFYLAFSPERIDPGDTTWTTRNIPRVVGGVDDESTRVAAALYGQIVEAVVQVSSTTAAEMVKLAENAFRAVNIGLVNELALACRTFGVDVWEIIDAAKSKPFGYMPFQPGPGVGGNCIPVDPFYLSWKAKHGGVQCRIIESAGRVNASMPRHVVDLVDEALNRRAQAVRGSRVHLLGMAYKPGVDDTRGSPAIDVALMLQARGATVSYSDPFVSTIAEGSLKLDAVPVDDALRDGIDCAVITTDHQGVDYLGLAARAPLIVDTRNALKGVDGEHIVRL